MAPQRALGDTHLEKIPERHAALDIVTVIGRRTKQRTSLAADVSPCILRRASISLPNLQPPVISILRGAGGRHNNRAAKRKDPADELCRAGC
jgi:hypothetical protein